MAAGDVVKSGGMKQIEQGRSSVYSGDDVGSLVCVSQTMLQAKGGSATHCVCMFRKKYRSG